MRILIAEDESITRRKLRRQIEQMGHEVIEAENGRAAWESFQSEPYPIVISDWEMPEMNGVDLVRNIRQADSSGYVYIVLLTGRSDKQDVVLGMEAGADDFVTKPFDRDELTARIKAGQRIVELEQNLGSANDRLRHELDVARELADAEHRKHQEALLGKSIPVRALRESIVDHANTDENLLLVGPTGAGHEAVARSIHHQSKRRDRPFIYVACAHLTPQDESLFQFRIIQDEPNGDQRSKLDEAQLPDKAKLADGGTLYLEGVELLPKELQTRLFNYLRNASERQAAGLRRIPDIRVIACSETHGHTQLAEKLHANLASVLGRIRLSIPSLAERRSDIRVIADHILKSRATATGKVLDGLSEDAENMLVRYAWPENIRELRSVVERAVLLANRGTVEIPSEFLSGGRRVGGYTLKQLIGKGGMGEVWLAKHSLLARPAAVKLIREQRLDGQGTDHEKLRERFQREAKATAKLRSPHTVELFDFGITEDGDFYYVMEYLNGVDLQRLMLEHGPLPLPRVIYLLRQACLSLAEAHRAGLVHRDVKPANLFVCEMGTEDDFLKLLDFGIVRSTDGVDQSIDETMGSSGMVKGTPAFISPEAAKGDPAVPASDIYSLGCVAFTLLTGGNLFVAEGVMPLLFKHIDEPPKPPSQFRRDLPTSVDEVVLSCLAKEPADRPTAKELQKKLESISLERPWDNDQAIQWWSENRFLRACLDEETDGETVDSASSGITYEIHPS